MTIYGRFLLPERQQHRIAAYLAPSTTGAYIAPFPRKNQYREYHGSRPATAPATSSCRLPMLRDNCFSYGDSTCRTAEFKHDVVVVVQTANQVVVHLEGNIELCE